MYILHVYLFVLLSLYFNIAIALFSNEKVDQPDLAKHDSSILGRFFLELKF